MLLCRDIRIKNWNSFKTGVTEKIIFRHSRLGLKIVAD